MLTKILTLLNNVFDTVKSSGPAVIGWFRANKKEHREDEVDTAIDNHNKSAVARILRRVKEARDKRHKRT